MNRNAAEGSEVIAYSPEHRAAFHPGPLQHSTINVKMQSGPMRPVSKWPCSPRTNRRTWRRCWRSLSACRGRRPARTFARRLPRKQGLSGKSRQELRGSAPTVVPVDLFGQQCRGQIAWPVRCFGVWAHVSLECRVAGGILQRGGPFRHVAAAVPVREADGPVEQPALRQQRRIARAGGIAGARVAAPKVRYLGEDSRLDDCSINRRIVRVLEL